MIRFVRAYRYHDEYMKKAGVPPQKRYQWSAGGTAKSYWSNVPRELRAMFPKIHYFKPGGPAVRVKFSAKVME